MFYTLLRNLHRRSEVTTITSKSFLYEMIRIRTNTIFITKTSLLVSSDVLVFVLGLLLTDTRTDAHSHTHAQQTHTL